MKNNSYIYNLKIEDVPWHRLPTTYGRATLFPQYFEILMKFIMKMMIASGMKMRMFFLIIFFTVFIRAEGLIPRRSVS